MNPSQPTPVHRQRVLVTGAAGRIAALILPALRERYDLTLVDVRDTDAAGAAAPGVEVLDLLDDAGNRFVELCREVDTIVHLGYARPGNAPSYAAERRNVDLADVVYSTAQATGVSRVVSTSTNQASKWYERPYKQGRLDRVGPWDYPRPDNFYGWAKVAYESLGFLYATGAVGPAVPNVQIRIVAPRPIKAAAFADRPLADYLRDITGWISERDLQQLYVRSIEAASIDDEHGVPFQIFYGVSNNARTFWSITNAREVIGYAPVDDSEAEFADEIAQMLTRDAE